MDPMCSTPHDNEDFGSWHIGECKAAFDEIVEIMTARGTLSQSKLLLLRELADEFCLSDKYTTSCLKKTASNPKLIAVARSIGKRKKCRTEDVTYIPGSTVNKERIIKEETIKSENQIIEQLINRDLINRSERKQLEHLYDVVMEPIMKKNSYSTWNRLKESFVSKLIDNKFHTAKRASDQVYALPSFIRDSIKNYLKIDNDNNTQFTDTTNTSSLLLSMIDELLKYPLTASVFTFGLDLNRKEILRSETDLIDRRFETFKELANNNDRKRKIDSSDDDDNISTITSSRLSSNSIVGNNILSSIEQSSNSLLNTTELKGLLPLDVVDAIDGLLNFGDSYVVHETSSNVINNNNNYTAIPAKSSTVTSANGSAVTSNNGLTITSANGSAVTFANGLTLTSANGSAVTSANDSTVTFAKGSSITSANGSSITSANGSSITSAKDSNVSSYADYDASSQAVHSDVRSIAVRKTTNSERTVPEKNAIIEVLAKNKMKKLKVVRNDESKTNC